jgi:hypothetical protein
MSKIDPWSTLFTRGREACGFFVLRRINSTGFMRGLTVQPRAAMFGMHDYHHSKGKIVPREMGLIADGLTMWQRMHPGSGSISHRQMRKS